MIYYCPLEAYKSRYTTQLSAPKTGWLERNWIKAKIPYRRIEADGIEENTCIETGVVLEPSRRVQVCFSQITQLLQLMDAGQITDDDVIYFDDFWHPGIEAIGYVAETQGKPIPKMFAFLWAQSVDEFDFTHKMKWWMRDIEKGYAHLLEGIFVACPYLQNLLSNADVSTGHTHVVGLPFSSEEVRERMPSFKHCMRMNRVVYSSRWDKEKNPDFFLEVADYVLRKTRGVEFVICTADDELRSNDESLKVVLEKYLKKYPNNILLRLGLSKTDYYRELVESKIQMNTADQDWVSFTLLEASVAGCWPLYPDYRAFPETLNYQRDYLYPRQQAKAAGDKIIRVLDYLPSMWSEKAIDQRSWIHTRFDDSWARMAEIMGQYKSKKILNYAFIK